MSANDWWYLPSALPGFKATPLEKHRSKDTVVIDAMEELKKIQPAGKVGAIKKEKVITEADAQYVRHCSKK